MRRTDAVGAAELRFLRWRDRFGAEIDRFTPRARKAGWFARTVRKKQEQKHQTRLLEFESLLIRQALQIWRENRDERVLKAIIRVLDIQMRFDELALVLDELDKRPNCRFLIFGVGNDSAFWQLANAGGETVFLESSPYWANVVLSRHPGLDCRLISYSTQHQNWRSDLHDLSQRHLELPSDVAAKQWDLILVDAPEGHHRDTPGRVQSIAAASTLAAPSGYVAVHDCDRQAEREICKTLLANYAPGQTAYRMRLFRRPRTEMAVTTGALTA